MNIFSKNLIEAFLHILVIAYLFICQDALAAKVYFGFLLFSILLVNIFMAEYFPNSLGLAGWPKAVFRVIADVLALAFSLHLAYGTSILAPVVEFLSRAQIEQTSSIPPGLGFDQEEIERNQELNRSLIEVWENLEVAPFGWDVVTFGVIFYIVSRGLWVIWLLHRRHA
ncbi:hypothetical protein TW86_19510 [Halomonas sp. S2151]|uniref:hypothetical protein n=1 Tax=Halomonas sp. S2151 TaxID=579478 RepID=UPI0005FA72E4|nr:hypothetical protein [Halomonas sp. S2151]KJZ06400.1 hypothetical protein TW86_19510 [Halomonas sp. S2151]